jgi:hypothetical protein
MSMTQEVVVKSKHTIRLLSETVSIVLMLAEQGPSYDYCMLLLQDRS